MAENARVSPLKTFLTLLTATLGLLGCSASQPASRPAAKATAVAPAAAPKTYFTPPRSDAAPRVMLGIDVLEADGFAAVKGKRIGLLTHPAGVNRLGVSTVDVLRRAPGVKLVALYAGEHGIYGDLPAEKNTPTRSIRAPVSWSTRSTAASPTRERASKPRPPN